MSINVQAIVSDLVRDIRDGKSIHEVIDSWNNTATFEEQQAVLDTIGDVDLSEPMPDLSMGWTAVRGQLAYNALYQAVARIVAR